MFNFRFSTEEIQQLFKAWIAISFAFALIFRKQLFWLGNPFSLFLFSAVTVGLSFLLHEIGHKLVAQKYGCWAEFRSFDWGLILAILSALGGGIVFAAPGAVFIIGSPSLEESGKISSAGIVVNLILAFVFFFLIILGLENAFLLVGQKINAWLALFNLLPFAFLDGEKIWRWNKFVWLGLFLSSGFIYLK